MDNGEWPHGGGAHALSPDCIPLLSRWNVCKGHGCPYALSGAAHPQRAADCWQPGRQSCQGGKGFSLDNESPHISLDKDQAKHLLAAIDTSASVGKRDYALISLLLRTGIRRAECVALNISDFTQEQGHTVATVRHGKGDKRRKVKIPVDVYRSLDSYLHSRTLSSLDEPLFTGIGRWKGQRISEKFIEHTVAEYGRKIGIELTPHDLRASFITLAIEGGATLLQAQYAAGHSDPRTTERYHIRKLNLDDNAVDYIKL